MTATTPAQGLSRADFEAARAFGRLSSGWWSGATARRAWFWTLLLAASILINVGVNVGVNRWNGWFFDALEKKDAHTAGLAIVVFPLIVVAAAGVGVLILKSRETLQVYWRQWLSGSLVEMWVANRRFQRLGPAGVEPANPEYRIADDVRWATEPLVDFAIGLLSAVITVLTFIGILWGIGGSLRVGAGDGAVTIPAYLVFAALAYGVIVSGLMILFGRRLPGKYALRAESEARFRFGLMRLRDSADAIAIGGGQHSERRAITTTYDTLAARWLAVVKERAKLTWITNGSGVLVPVVPLLLAAPKYLSGEMSLGGVIQVAAAFVQVQMAFNWILDNYMRIAEWLASARRVNDLAAAIARLEDLPPDSIAAPRLIAGAPGALAAHELIVTDREGRALAEPISCEVKAGQTLHLSGLTADAGAAVMRAFADQWSWGAGVVARAPEARVCGAARRMRWAEAPLADVILHDEHGLRGEAADAAEALARVGLGHFAPRLAEIADWDKALTETERRRLAFARLHALKPDIVLIDDGLYGLAEPDQAALFADLRTALAQSVMVTSGSGAVFEAAADLVLARSGGALVSRPAKTTNPATPASNARARARKA